MMVEKNNIRAYGYARVSTQGQELAAQVDTLQNYAKMRNIDLVGIFQEKASGKDTNREEFQKMMRSLELNPLGVEAIVITKLDRIARSLLNLIQISSGLDEKKIGLISISNNIDTTTKEGRLFFYLMGALGEFERELILERTQDGLKRARVFGTKSGRAFGRPTKNISAQEIKNLLAMGLSKSAIARKFAVHRTTIYKKLEDKVS